MQTVRRIVIVGASGCGKTTLGKQLSEILNLPLCDLDELSWLPGWALRDRKEERADVERVTQQEKWIVVGNYSRHRDITWYRADLIIWLDLPLYTCLWRGLRRALENILYKTPICNGNYDSFTRPFSWDNRSIVHWIWTTHSTKRERYQRILVAEKDDRLPPHYHLRSSYEVANLIDHIKEFVDSLDP